MQICNKIVKYGKNKFGIVPDGVSSSVFLGCFWGVPGGMHPQSRIASPSQSSLSNRSIWILRLVSFLPSPSFRRMALLIFTCPGFFM